MVQDALGDTAQKLDDYLARRPVPFYLWLRQLTWEQLVKTHQRHMARKRTVARDEPPPLSDQSVRELADRLAGSTSSPSRRPERAELHARVRQALERLSTTDREVLALRHLEQLSTAATAAVVGCSTGAVKVRLLRALQRLPALLDSP